MASFETLLGRLAQRRGWDAAAVTDIAGGDITSPEALRRLAPALGWRTADLFALAGHDLPDDLAPTDWLADPGSLAWEMTYIPPARPILLAAARSLPQLPRTDAPARSEIFPNAPRRVLGQLLVGRNLRLTSATKLLLSAGGPYLAASTVGKICVGRKAPDALFLNGFADGLGLPVEDLAVLCSAKMTESLPSIGHAAELADMIWECRRLTGQQIDELHELGHELRHRFAGDMNKHARCSCPG